MCRKYREAVATQSPGLLQPWVVPNQINRNAVASAIGLRRSSLSIAGRQLSEDATRCGLHFGLVSFPGLKQPWALGRNRFAVIKLEVRKSSTRREALSAFVIEHCLCRLSVIRQGTMFTNGVWSLKDPVLPGCQSSVNLRVHCLWSGESERCLHSG